MTLGDYEGRIVDRATCASRSSRCPRTSRPTSRRSRGLPDDRCQCPHLGYLISGSFRVTYRDGREEIVRAGEAYHLEPGHFVQTLEPVELVEFSPRAEHDETMAAVVRNIGHGGLTMHGSIWTFNGDPDDLLERYDAMVAEILADRRAARCACAPRTASSSSTPARIGMRSIGSRQVEFGELRERHGLPPLARVEDFPVHAAIIDARLA